jgi:ParB-like chromosome segregation protein Spo0J
MSDLSTLVLGVESDQANAASTPSLLGGQGRWVTGERPTSLAIESLRPADSPRLEGVSSEHVRALAEADGALPPILVHRATMQVIDGMHRLNAARLTGRERIDAEFFEGSNEEAFLLAVRANISHGLPLNLADRRAAAKRIMAENPRLSDRAIAATTGLAAKTVAAIRACAAEEMQHSNIRIGRDGRARPLDSTEGRRIAGQFIAAHPEASLRRIAAQSGISVGTARDVRRRVQAGEDPVPAGTHVTAKGSQAARPTRVEGQVDQSMGGVDSRKMLEGLQRDPSLRYTEAGRSVLRWLGQRTVAAAEWRDHVDGLPPHAQLIVSRIARASAAAWQAFADELDARGATNA